jgi:hypothetical protein
MRDENDTTTADLPLTPATELESDKAGRAEFTIAGFGTGTVAELEAHLYQVADERDTARRALAELERRTKSPDVLGGAELLAAISGIAERAAERVAERAAADVDGDAVWEELEWRIRDTIEDAAAEIDGAAIWAEIEERAGEAAAEAARQVVRDELVVNVDLI